MVDIMLYRYANIDTSGARILPALQLEQLYEVNLVGFFWLGFQVGQNDVKWDDFVDDLQRVQQNNVQLK